MSASVCALFSASRAFSVSRFFRLSLSTCSDITDAAVLFFEPSLFDDVVDDFADDLVDDLAADFVDDLATDLADAASAG